MLLMAAYVYLCYRGEDADDLNKEIHALKVYEGDKTIGEVYMYIYIYINTYSFNAPPPPAC